MAQKKRLVIIGGGFAGLNLVKNIDKDKWQVILVDRNNYHSFPPLFYQVASSGLEPVSISFPFRHEMRRRRLAGCSYRMGDVQSIDMSRRTVTTQYETIEYDDLVIAAGTTNNFFGIADLEKHVFTLKSTSEAIRLRNEILDRLERASMIADPRCRESLLTFIVVGGGPAGVEIAGALGEMKRYVLEREYPEINPDEVCVRLVEGSDRLLRAMSVKSSEAALIGLRQLMVDVSLEKTMQSYRDGVATFVDGETIACETVIWAAGITGETFALKGSEVAIGAGGRFVVDEYNRVIGADNVYAIGDIALHKSAKWPHGCPQLAQGAIQQAQVLAYNLNRGRCVKPFEYKDKGSMATIGRNRAVVDIGQRHMSGWVAWFIWMFVHLMSLLGMRNKTIVLLNWMWSYFTFSTSLRVLMRPSRYPLRSRWAKKENRHTLTPE